MANIKSAEKKNRQMIKNRARNRAAMSALRSAVKKARAAVDEKSNDAAALVKDAISTINKAVSKGVLKAQTASRYVSRLSTRGRSASA
jgi:small subunit ribosomal protein S20